jgi:AraC-like DNA-binding protein
MIGKSRQSPSRGRVKGSFDAGLEKTRGVLSWPPSVGRFKHVRRRPPADLAAWIDSYWMVTWDLPEHYLQETLPHPNIHFVFEKGKCVIFGTSTRKFSRMLEGKDGVFGVKFRPGGFRPFIKGPVADLLNCVVPATRFFGQETAALQNTLASLSWKTDKMIEASNAFFRARLPAPDPKIDLAAEIVRLIVERREIKTVADLKANTGIGIRKLQRLFSEYVGVSPKWVIRRNRLHELVGILNSGVQPNWPQVALELGYFDQAHLINEFKSIVGSPPAEYQKLSTRKGISSPRAWPRDR